MSQCGTFPSLSTERIVSWETLRLRQTSKSGRFTIAPEMSLLGIYSQIVLFIMSNNSGAAKQIVSSL